MGAAENRDSETEDVETSERLTRIEVLLAQLLGEIRAKRRSAAKSKRSVAQKSLAAAQALKPTEFEIAAARRALARRKVR
jgi:hypothetical protein